MGTKKKKAERPALTDEICQMNISLIWGCLQGCFQGNKSIHYSTLLVDIEVIPIYALPLCHGFLHNFSIRLLFQLPISIVAYYVQS